MAVATKKMISIDEEKLIQFRKTLHQYPEIFEEERETAKRIVEFMKPYNPTKIVEGVGGHGVLVYFGNDDQAKTIAVRCELDALPIKEVNTFEHKSVDPNVSHKCGHDGHMAIVAGLGTILSKEKPSNVNVVLIFQPAEENGMGADAMVNDPKWQEVNPDYILALHNVPKFEKHTIILKENSFTPAVKSLIIELNGKTAHAAEPHNGINPAIALAKIILKADELENNQPDQEDFKLVTMIQTELGEEAYGVSAGHAVIRYTIRAWSDEILKKLEDDFVSAIHKIVGEEQLECNISETQPFSANNNNTELIGNIRNAANNLGLKILEKDMPFSWGEDFGTFTQLYPGALFGMGAGKETPALHNPDYDFPDEIIKTGIEVLYETICQLSKS